MAMQRASQPVQAPVPEPEDAEMESGTEEELEKLESDVKHMAENILQYRSTLPDQLKNAFALLASAHRPESPWEEHGSQLGPSGTSSRGPCGNSESGESPVSKRDRETAKKIEMLKDKTSKNVSTLPIILKRMKDCISTIDNLNPHPSSIHPAFRKDRNS